MKTGAVIVAAGMSSRMKAFKPMLSLRGSTIIKTVISSLRSAGVGEIAVVTGNKAGLLTEHLSATGITCLYNPNYETTEMFDSAKIGLNYLKDRCDRIFFLPGDVPLFSKRSLKILTAEMDRDGCEILMPVHDGKSGHPILLDNSVIPFLVSYQGSGGLKGAIDYFPGLKRTIQLDDIGMTLDADRPEDYERLKDYAGRLRDDTDETDV